MKMKKLLVFVIMAAMLISLAGCARPAVQPEQSPGQQAGQPAKTAIEITDFKGRTITLDKAPERIISLSPSNTEILFTLGAGDKVVGVTSYCDYPEEVKNIQKVGTFDGPNMELIKQAQPDVVLAGYIQEEAVKAMEAMGITVIVTEAESFEAIYTSIDIIGKITGTEAKANEIIKGMKDKIAEIQTRNSDKEKKKVFYVVWTDPLTTAGSKTFIDDVIKTAGGINVADKVEGWADYSAEQLMQDAPDMLIAALHSTDKGMAKADLENNPIFNKLQCVKAGKVYVMSDDNIISRPGPRIVQGIEEMQRALYGE